MINMLFAKPSHHSRADKIHFAGDLPFTDVMTMVKSSLANVASSRRWRL